MNKGKYKGEERSLTAEGLLDWNSFWHNIVLVLSQFFTVEGTNLLCHYTHEMWFCLFSFGFVES